MVVGCRFDLESVTPSPKSMAARSVRVRGRDGGRGQHMRMCSGSCTAQGCEARDVLRSL